MGFRVKVEFKVRLYGINAPEITGASRPAGLKTKQRVIELISNKDIILKTFKDKQEKFGRWLADIYINDSDTKSVNQMLIEEKLAVPFMVD